MVTVLKHFKAILQAILRIFMMIFKNEYLKLFFNETFTL